MLKKFESVGLNSNCFEKLKRDILDGIYMPGEKLSMAKMKKDLSTGQSPIREALSRLRAKGLVYQEENKGFRVTRISESDLRDLFNTISQVATIAIRQSIELGDDNWEMNLVAVFHQLFINENSKNSFDYLFVAKCDFHFYKALILGCNSAHLLRIHDILFLKFEFYIKLALKFNPLFMKAGYQRKKLLLEAALKRDADAACLIFIDNHNDIQENVIKALNSLFSTQC